MATGIWVRLMRKNRIEQDITSPCTLEDWQEALESACQKLDVPRPMILPRHERDWDQFSQARFLPDHFVEQGGVSDKAYTSFKTAEAYWLDDYSLFMAIKLEQEGK